MIVKSVVGVSRDWKAAKTRTVREKHTFKDSFARRPEGITEFPNPLFASRIWQPPDGIVLLGNSNNGTNNGGEGSGGGGGNNSNNGTNN
jgi:hypothetical protein